MSSLKVKDVMHPRTSLPMNARGDEVVLKLMCGYPALPVVDDGGHVMGIVSDYDIFDALHEKRTVHEFSAESIMSCGHIDHADVCNEPVSVSPETDIEDLLELFYRHRVTVMPVVEEKKLVGIVARKNVIYALAEKGFWKEHEFQKRV